MFPSMLMFYEAMNPKQLWDAHWESLSDDIEAMTSHERDDPTVTRSEDALKDCALYEINQVLINNGLRLEDFPTFLKSNYVPPVHGVLQPHFGLSVRMKLTLPKVGMSQPHFELSVKMKFTLPKVGTWSPLGLPKTQSSSSRVKTPCTGVFFIPLERS
jgi:hypothetical protein